MQFSLVLTLGPFVFLATVCFLCIPLNKFMSCTYTSVFNYILLKDPAVCLLDNYMCNPFLYSLYSVVL